MSLELEQWSVCERQLEDVLLLHTLLLVPLPQGAAGGAAAHCSVKSLLEGGKGGTQQKAVLFSCVSIEGLRPSKGGHVIMLCKVLP